MNTSKMSRHAACQPLSRVERQRLIETAMKKRKADLVLKNAKILDVFTEQLYEGDIALCDGRIAGIGSYEGQKELDLTGKTVVPGLVDAHFHIESSMAVPSSLSPALLEHGVCTVIADPHEIVNASGKDGLDFMLEDAGRSVIDYFFMIPSSVPSCDFEVNGAGTFPADQMKDYAYRSDVLGLAEVMRMQDVLDAEPEMMNKFDLFSSRMIDGHAPGLSGQALQAYRAAGVRNDHEAGTYEEALERLHSGFQLLIRQGSGARNLPVLLGGLLEHHIPLDRCSLCTDDKHIEDIFAEGTIDQAIRDAISIGCTPAKAVKMGSLQSAAHYHLTDRGAIAPGYLADLVILDDLDSFAIHSVFKNGQPVSGKFSEDYSAKEKDSPENEAAADRSETVDLPASLRSSVHLPVFTLEDLKTESGELEGLEMVPDQLLTRKMKFHFDETNYPSRQYNMLIAAERYGKTGEFALCPLSGYGLHGGAIVMSYAHDSHNVIGAADNPQDLLLALNKLQEIEGGIVLVENGKVFDALPMEVSGLMSILPAEEIARRIDAMKNKAREMGVPEGIDSFANLSFLSLPVIPEVRLCPQGLYDVNGKKLIARGRRKPVS